MEQNYERFNMFLESIHSGTKIFKIYKSLALNNQLIELLNEIISYFKKHEENITQFLVGKNVEANDSLSCGREFIVWIEKIKTEMMLGRTANTGVKNEKEMEDNDFDICINCLKGINMGSTKGIEFIYKYKDLDTSILKDILNDYSYLYNKVSDYTLKQL